MTADRSAMRMLGIAAGAPVMEVRRTALTLGGKPVAYRVSTIDTAHHGIRAPVVAAGMAARAAP